MKTPAKIFSLGLVLILTGCVTLYKPNVVHSPLLQEKGQFNTSAVLGLSGSGVANVQAAYAVSDHVGIMADGMYHGRRISDEESVNEKLDMISGEAGVGYFRKFGSQNNLLFQFYTGGGYGTTSDVILYPDQPNPEANADFYNLFIQPGLAFTSKHFEIAFDLKANYVQLFNINAYLYDQFEWWNTDSKFRSDTTLNFMNLEPTITFKAGGEKLKLFLQTGLSLPTIHSDNFFSVNSESMLLIPLVKLSVGISYRF